MKYYTEHHKKACCHCGRLIDVACLQRHENVCLKNSQLPKKDVYKLDHDDLFCKFCKKEFKNRNALVQHELRCKENLNRKSFDNFVEYIRIERKGKTKDNCADIQKQCDTMHKKYEDGYVSPSKGRKNIFEYLYKEHNDQEIQKWFDYLDSKEFIIPEHEVSGHPEDYLIVRKTGQKINNSVIYEFEHDFVANIFLDGKLLKTNTVHHIDKCRSNNDKKNLMVFETNSEHKRFHNSQYAYLIYNEDTHLFNCILKHK